jgi:UDP-N-acetylmuramate-alanine ligase
VYSAGEAVDKKYNKVKFAKLISKFSKTQVIIVKDELDIIKYFKKNLINNEIVIGMGAGSISKWMYSLKNNL